MSNTDEHLYTAGELATLFLCRSDSEDDPDVTYDINHTMLVDFCHWLRVTLPMSDVVGTRFIAKGRTL